MLKFIRDLIYKIPVPAPVQEAILEALRLGVLALFSTILTVLIERVQSFPYPEVWVTVLTLLLRGLDKYKHEDNKETLKKTEYNGGLLGF